MGDFRDLSKKEIEESPGRPLYLNVFLESGENTDESKLLQFFALYCLKIFSEAKTDIERFKIKNVLQVEINQNTEIIDKQQYLDVVEIADRFSKSKNMLQIMAMTLRSIKHITIKSRGIENPPDIFGKQRQINAMKILIRETKRSSMSARLELRDFFFSFARKKK